MAGDDTKKKKSSSSSSKSGVSRKKKSSSSSSKANVTRSKDDAPKEKKEVAKTDSNASPFVKAVERPKTGAAGKIDFGPQIGYEDMTKMEDMTLDGVLDNLKERYERNLIYTYTSTILVAINPYQRFDIYNINWVKAYKGKRIGILPPHVFAVAETTYSNMVNLGRNQSCLVSGESGAGKTETTKLIMQFLSERTEREGSVDKMVLATFPILEALGNAKTGRNDNSSRFGKFIEIQFDNDNYICGARIIPYLLEKSRLVWQAKGERNYHIFYMLTNGMDEAERKKYHLEKSEFYTFTNRSGCKHVDEYEEDEEMQRFKDALTLFDITDEMQANIFKIVSATLWLGNVLWKPDGDKADFQDAVSEKAIDVVAELLGLDGEYLKWALRFRKIKTMREVIDKPLTAQQARDQTDAFAKQVYAVMFEWCVQQLNQNMISETYKSFIGVLDIFGFEVFELNSFEQFLINYTNEKLQQFFNHQIFKLEQKIYEEENIDWSVIEFKDNQECLDLIEQRRPPGLLSILDEESKFPRATDDTLIEKLHSNFDKKHAYYEKPRLKNRVFAVKHFAGSVQYNVTDWRDKNRDELPEHLTVALQNSTNPFISILYTGEGEGKDAESKVTLKDDGARMSFGPDSGRGGKKKDTAKMTLGQLFKQQLVDLMTMLGATDPYFVRCIKPNSFKKPNCLDQKLTYDQLLYAGMLETIRIRRMGYPIRYTHEYFWKRFKCICPEVAPKGEDFKASTSDLLKALGVPMPWECQLGKTKVFFKQDTANDLEDKRLVALTSVIIKMQNWWRYVGLRARFVETRENTCMIQTWWRFAHWRGQFNRQRNSASLIGAYWRMLRAIRLKAALAEKKRKAEEARRKKEEEERQKRIAKYGAEKVEEEEREKQKKEAEKIRALAAGHEVVEPPPKKKKKKKPALQRAISIKMEKMDELEVPINVDGKITLAIGWKKSDWPLDISVLLFRYQQHKEDVYFYKPRSRDGAVIHKSGWSGGKKKLPGDDQEHIEVNLHKMSSKTNTVVIVGCVFNPKGDLSSVQDAYVRLFDIRTDHEFCHYPMEQSGKETARIVCKLFRFGFTRWRLKAIGDGAKGRVYKHMIPTVKPYLDEEPPKRKLRVTVHDADVSITYPEGQEPGRKATMHTFCYIRFDNAAEKTKIDKAAAPKSGVSYKATYETTKAVSGSAKSLEITLMQTKRMGKESFLGRTIVELDDKGLNLKKESLAMEVPEKDWAEGLVLAAGTIRVSIGKA